MPKRRKKGRPTARSSFKVGDRVRVRRGVTDVDYPDLPLSGWAGTISELHSGGLVSLQWDRLTLASIHPAYKERCLADGAVLEEYCLGCEDLEHDHGGPPSIERPTTIVARALSPKNPSDRVRMVFALSADERLPRPFEDALATYRDYLVTELSFPFEAKFQFDTFSFEHQPVRIVNVVALARDVDLVDGILCEAHTSRGDDVLPLELLRPRRSDPNYQLVDDYVTWFRGELAARFEVDPDELDDDDDDFAADDEGDDDVDDDYDEDDGDEDERDSVEDLPSGRWPAWVYGVGLLFQLVAVSFGYGATLGAVIVVMPGAKWAASIAGGLFGAVNALFEAKSFARRFSFVIPRSGNAVGGVLGTIAGAITGAPYGIAVVAFMGALPGTLAGFLLKRSLVGAERSAYNVMPGILWSCTALGMALEAFYRNPQQAAHGFVYGGLVGLAGGLVVCILLPVAYYTVRWRSNRKRSGTSFSPPHSATGQSPR